MATRVARIAIVALVATALRAEAQAQDAEWGPATNGLRCRLTVEPTSAPQGANVRFKVELRADAASRSAGVSWLRRGDERERLVFVFTLATGRGARPYVVPAKPVGGPPDPLPPDLATYLAPIEGPFEPVETALALVPTAPLELPAGEYRVFARMRAARAPDEVSGRVFTGELCSNDVLVRVTTAEPRRAKVQLPRWLQLVPAEGGLSSLVPGELGDVESSLRPGLAGACRVEELAVRPGASLEQPTETWRSGGAEPGWPAEGRSAERRPHDARVWIRVRLYQCSPCFFRPFAGPMSPPLWTGFFRAGVGAPERAPTVAEANETAAVWHLADYFLVQRYRRTCPNPVPAFAARVAECGDWGDDLRPLARAAATREPLDGYVFSDLAGDEVAGDYDPKEAFGVCAAPARAGETGIRTFVIDQRGVIYSADLAGSAVKRFPDVGRADSRWRPIE